MEFKILKSKSKLYELKFSLDFLHSQKKRFTFVKSKKNPHFGLIINKDGTKRPYKKDNGRSAHDPTGVC